MNDVLEQILTQGHTYWEDGIKKHRPHGKTSISREKSEFLHQLVMDLKPTHSLEVGLAYGVSALSICDALAATAGAQHIVIDPMQSTKFENVGLENLNKARFREFVEFHESPSYLALPQLAAAERKIDFAFVDGAHWYDFVLLDFFYIDRMLRPGGVIAFDDTSETFAGIRKVLRFIVTNRSYSVFRCLGGRARRLEQLRKPLRWAGRCCSPIRSLLRPEFLESDSQLGLMPGSPLIALKKESDDERPWNSFRDF